LKNRRNVSLGLGDLTPIHLDFGGWGSGPDSCLLLLYTVTTFYKATFPAIKRSILVEKEQTSSLIHFKLCTFCWLERKTLFVTVARYPSYAIDCGWLNTGFGLLWKSSGCNKGKQLLNGTTESKVELELN